MNLIDARRIVIERAHIDGVVACERCGHTITNDAFGYSVHHRIPRQMGGSKDPRISMPSNLLLLCGSGVTGCHGAVESSRMLAFDAGWLVHRTSDPREEMVLYRDQWAWLDDDGHVFFIGRDAA